MKSPKRPLHFIMALLVPVLSNTIPASPVLAEPPACSVTQMTFVPHSSVQGPYLNNNGDMVWEQIVNSVWGSIWEIMLYDAATGTIAQLTGGSSAHNFRPAISDTGDAVWSRSQSSDQDVMLYNAETGAVTQLTADVSCRNLGSVDVNNNGDVVWSSDDFCMGSGYDIYMYDATTGTTSQLTNNDNNDIAPAINDNKDVVWSKRPVNYSDRSQTEIYRYDGTSGAITRLTTNTTEEGLPSVNNNGDAVWSDNEGNPRDVHLYDSATGNITNLTHYVTGEFSSSPSINDQGDVTWSGRTLSQQHYTNEIYLYEAASGTITRLTEDTGDDNGPIINNLREVAWWGTKASDGTSNSSRQIYFYSPKRPKANAGVDQSAGLDVPVILDGSGSCDPNADELIFAWTMIAKPPGSSAVLYDADTAMPGFSVDFPGDYAIQLRVTDLFGAVSVPDTVTVSGINIAPVADAGPDQVINFVGTVVTLDGSQSHDDDDDALTYQWTILSKPSDSNAALNDPTIVNPIFVADVNATYWIELVVTDIFGLSSMRDRVAVSFDNVAPVADAGDNQAAAVSDSVTLDGSGSSDANLEPVYYDWSFISIPLGSIAWLAGDTTVNPTFYADLPGTYIASLSVRDRQVSSDVPDSVIIEVVSTVDGLTETLMGTIDVINALDDSHFKHHKKKKKLTRILNSVLHSIEEEVYEWAVKKLEKGVLGNIDGCALNGEPDRKDWLRTCEAQDQTYPLVLAAIGYINEILNPSEPPPEPPPPPPPGGGGL